MLTVAPVSIRTLFNFSPSNLALTYNALVCKLLTLVFLKIFDSDEEINEYHDIYENDYLQNDILHEFKKERDELVITN